MNLKNRINFFGIKKEFYGVFQNKKKKKKYCLLKSNPSIRLADIGKEYPIYYQTQIEFRDGKFRCTFRYIPNSIQNLRITIPGYFKKYSINNSSVVDFIKNIFFETFINHRFYFLQQCTSRGF